MNSVDTKTIDNMNYFELLAWLGIGSAHPGGFPATKQNLASLEIKPEEYILDAGCGSGLTACFLAKNLGCRIVGIDINEQMIEKAIHRAEKERVSHLVEFRTADVYNLPFAANTFDLVLAESLTVFLEKEKVYRQFYKVLKPGGRLADLEMALMQEMPENIREQMHLCFGPTTDPLTFEGWVEVLQSAGFEYKGIGNPQYLKPGGPGIVDELKKDWLLLKDLAKKVGENPGILGRIQKNAGFMKQNYNYFGYGIICGRKPMPVYSGLLRRLLRVK